MSKQSDSIQAQGGRARADKLTADQRKEIASKAATARWNSDLPLAPFNGEIEIGSKKILCAVLEDGTRLITTRGFLMALDRPWRGTYEGTDAPNFIAAANLKPFIDQEMGGVPTPIKYRTENNVVREGYAANVLRQVCNVYLLARRAGGVLRKNQEPIAVAAEIVLNAFAEVGIAALIDEATGYQDFRAKDALARILEEFVAKELQGWTKTFPVDFYREIFRLRKWPFDPSSVKKPQVIGHWTNDFIYARLAPGVLDELKRKNPAEDGRRKNRHHQWLTGEVGHPKLIAQIEGVKVLMKTSATWDEFQEKLEDVYPKRETTALGFEVEVRRSGK